MMREKIKFKYEMFAGGRIENVTYDEFETMDEGYRFGKHLLEHYDKVIVKIRIKIIEERTMRVLTPPKAEMKK